MQQISNLKDLEMIETKMHRDGHENGHPEIEVPDNFQTQTIMTHNASSELRSNEAGNCELILPEDEEE